MDDRFIDLPEERKASRNKVARKTLTKVTYILLVFTGILLLLSFIVQVRWLQVAFCVMGCGVGSVTCLLHLDVFKITDKNGKKI